jgi:bifunctional DNA-binding transcriptional regulator/antitoxin component of YhaV-PrlF toxin-antitoxin module
MKILKRRTIDISGSIYAPIPFWIAENYGIRRNSPVEYETEDDSVLVIKIGKTKHE